MRFHAAYEQIFEFAPSGFDRVVTYYVIWKETLYALNEYSLENEEHEVSGWSMLLEKKDPEELISQAVHRGKPTVLLAPEKSAPLWKEFLQRLQNDAVEFVAYSRAKDHGSLDDQQWEELRASLLQF